jgi:uncharacterized protein YdeI (YjbR/CyaY-like superfamily)
MGKRDPRVDAYIAKSADFAKPILAHLRETVHAACPEVEEAIKWSTPAFMYRGMLCGMAAFKQHATFGFWKNSLVFGDRATSTNPMEQFGRLTKVSDLPPAATLSAYVRKAARLNDEGVKVARKPKAAPKPIRVPADLAAALKKVKRAQAAFDAFSPSHKREYIEWITEAKSNETHARRLTQAVAWIAEGKSRNWKYERK